MIKLKAGVRLSLLCPQIVLAVEIANGVYMQAGGYDCWITSANDDISKHMAGSRHYQGKAVDLRIHNVPEDKRRGLCKALCGAFANPYDDKTWTWVGPNFDILWENPGTEDEHIHIEYDPK